MDKFGMTIGVIVMINFLIAFSVAQDSCNDPNYIIPVVTLDTIFDNGYGAIRSS